MRLPFREKDQANNNPTVIGLFAAIDGASTPQQFDTDAMMPMP